MQALQRVSVNVPQYAGKLALIVGAGITVEFAGKTAENPEEAKQLIRQYILNKILRAFDIVEFNRVPVQGGAMYFNNNRTAVKLPKVKMDLHGKFLETKEEFFVRSKPELAKWLNKSAQNALDTVEIMEGIMTNHVDA